MIKHFKGKTPKIDPSAYISETATIIGDVEIGADSGVWPGVVIRADWAPIRIGARTIVEDNCVVHCGAPMEIGDNVIIGHGVVVHGKTIGSNNLIGSHATILDNVEIGNFCVIGAGCLVSPGMKIPDRSLVFGVPAKITGQVKPRHMQRLERGNLFYLEMYKHYREEGI
jgi:carbonic anhydrase/acetyltransferase-like protein (isoleucine patch superfamily)